MACFFHVKTKHRFVVALAEKKPAKGQFFLVFLSLLSQVRATSFC